MDPLDVDAELVAVRSADVGEVVDHLGDVLLEVEPRVALSRAPERAAEAGHAGDRHRRAGARVGVEHGSLVPMCVLDPELVQLAGAERRNDLTTDRIHRVEEVGRLLERHQPAAAVIRGVVVESHPADRGTIGGAELHVALGDEKLSGLDVRHERWLRLQPDRRDVCRRDGDRAVRRQIAPRLLPAQIEERLVPHQRATEGGRAGIHLGVGTGRISRRLCAGRRDRGAAEEEREGAERLTPEQVAAIAAEGVGARRGHRVVHHPHRLAELRREAGGDDFYFLDHHLGHRQQAEAGAILFGVGVAVDHVVDPHRGAVGGQTRHAELDVLDPGHARLHEREVVRIARDQRKVVDFEIAHRVADVDARDVERRDVAAAHGDRLAHGADRQRRVHDRRLPHRQPDVGALELLEALQFRDDAVSSERQQRRAVQALVVRDHRSFSAGVDVGDGHRDARQHAAGAIRNRAFDGTVGGL